MSHTHTVNYRAQEDQPQRWRLLDRGFWINDIPRPLLACRALGHKPVVDGTGEPGEPGYLSRWVTCDRCGVRPNNQGNLDPAEWNIGDAYTGEWGGPPPAPPELQKRLEDAARAHRNRPPEPVYFPPGPWPDNPTWTFGGQVILGKNIPGASIEVKLGNCGSEHTLAAHIRLHPIGALYLHTERLGTWLQRRLNPVGYESRVIGADIGHGRFSWKLWAKRDSWSRTDPRWQQGSIGINPMVKMFGTKRYWYTDVGDSVNVVTRLPHGDDHTVKVQLQRRDHGRPKLRRRFDAWTVDWDCKGGIPTKPGNRGRISGASVEVSADSVRKGTWPIEAAAAIATKLTQQRARNGMRSSEEAAR